VTSISGFLQTLTGLLQGEPLRVIVYSAAVVVWLVTHIAISIGYTGFGASAPSLDAALLVATAAAAAITEVCRQFVYSPATVATLIPDGMTAGGEDQPATPEA